MSKKSAKIAELIEGCRGRDLDPHYLGYFECFNRRWYYEAHDVLEELWLADRQGVDGAFYKGLIQLAGAFVHLQKGRLRPAAALFKLARTHLGSYPTPHQRLDLAAIRSMIEHWLQALDAGQYERNPYAESNAPRLELA